MNRIVRLVARAGVLASVGVSRSQRAKLPHDQADLAEWLEASGSRIQVPGAVGGAGFALPSLKGGRIQRFSNGNAIIFCTDKGVSPRVNVSFDRRARDNLVVIGPASTRPTHLRFQGSNNLCIFAGETAWPLDLDVRFSSDRGCLFMGRGATSNGTSIILEGIGRSVFVGEDCMFAAGSAIRTSDLHALIDRATGTCLNPSADVILNPHVWVGQDVLISKGVTVGSGAVIGAKSLVTRDVPAETVAGGVPAHVIRERVTWSRDRPF